jgi:diguanylate cyclase (GGDEF)-like protein/PAS domain S-box-containing protein
VPSVDPNRILIVEDDAGLGTPAADALRAAGHEPGVPVTGAGALREALADPTARLVVAVCSDPQGEGCTLLEALAGPGRDTACVVVCPDPASGAIVALMRAGADDVVPSTEIARLPAAAARALGDAAGRVAARRAEAERARVNDRLSGLMRGAADILGVAIADADGRITEWGEGAERMLGHAAADVVGSADLTLGHDPQELAARARELGLADGLAALMADAREGGAIQREWWHVRRDGTRFPAVRVIAPILDEGGRLTGYVGLCRDVSRRRRNEDERAALQRLATAVAGESDDRVIFSRVAREAATIIGGDAGGVSRFGTDIAVEVGTWQRAGVTGKRLGAPTPLDGPTAVAAVHRTGQGAWIGDVTQALDAATFEGWGGRPGFRAVVACPVRVDGRTWGALWVGAARAGVFGADDEARLARFADLAGLAIANAEARERVVSDALAGMFRGDLDIDGTIDLVVAAARRAMGADRATCYVHVAGGAAVESVHTTESDPGLRAFLEASRGRTRAEMPMWQMIAAGPSRTMVIEDLAGDATVPDAMARRLGAGAVVGIRLEHPSIRRDGQPELLGTLFLSYRVPRRFSARERAAAESLAGMAAVALANARLHADSLRSAIEIQAHATSDPLTGLANHRAFQERLAHEVTRARRHGRSLALALIDIDHFRRVNERNGHEAGDRVLVGIAGLLRSAAREADLVARVGGEEIAWLMPETEAMDAWQAVDRMRETVARTSVAEGVHVTVSAGVCDLAQAGSAGELLRLAEGALYWAKQHGRDVAFLYSPSVVEELSAEERADRLQRVQALQSIRVLARAVDAKDTSTREHSERVADLAVALGTAIGWEADRLVRLREAGLVHDVGKIGVPDAILFKPARLTPAEYEEIMRHAAIGAEMVADVLTPEQVSWVRGHHERWDGGGYPDGLAGERIPEGARVLALADAWDVMTSERPYHAPLTVADALAECRRCAGTQFSADLVGAIGRLVGAGAVLPGS